MLPTGYVNQSDSSPSNISQEGSESQLPELSLTNLTLYIYRLLTFFEQYIRAILLSESAQLKQQQQQKFNGI